ncbi:MAG: aldo/keto reductase [Alphaproteobacteria bacterium]|jgi:aryl-alcohol dehydrogenase-like predicted oxidoreductase|nr:aldo/keto reductase [Alphaproteobacteria bacterium]
MKPALALGTAQFGLAYGATNTHGQVSPDTVAALLNAVKGTVAYLDTAPAYGTAESILGATLSPDHTFKIITKIPAGINSMSVAATLEKSLESLRVSQVYGLLLHDTAGLLGADGDALWHALELAQTSGLVKKIGVSVYDAETALRLLRRYPIKLVQLPCSVLDQRALTSGALHAMVQQGVEVHARSIFLQGTLLLENAAALPPQLRPHQQIFDRYIEKRGAAQLSPLSACVDFIKAQSALAAAVIGLTNLQEWQDLKQQWSTATSKRDWTPFAETGNTAALDPRTWPQPVKVAA